MKNKKIEQIRQIIDSDNTFTADEIQWLKEKRLNPVKDNYLILMPDETPSGTIHVTERDRAMARRIKAKMPDLEIIEFVVPDEPKNE